MNQKQRVWDSLYGALQPYMKLLRRFVTALSDAKDIKSIYDFLLIAHKTEKIIKVDWVEIVVN